MKKECGISNAMDGTENDLLFDSADKAGVDSPEWSGIPTLKEYMMNLVMYFFKQILIIVRNLMRFRYTCSRVVLLILIT